MSFSDRIKVAAVADAVEATLGVPETGFVAFPDGPTEYCIVSADGEWEVGEGIVTGSTLSRDTVESNYLGNSDHIDFTGLDIQIAQVVSAEWLNSVQPCRAKYTMDLASLEATYPYLSVLGIVNYTNVILVSDTTGSDANDPSLAPMKTIGGALTHAVAGDLIVLEPGTYQATGNGIYANYGTTMYIPLGIDIIAATPGQVFITNDPADYRDTPIINKQEIGNLDSDGRIFGMVFLHDTQGNSTNYTVSMLRNTPANIFNCVYQNTDGGAGRASLNYNNTCNTGDEVYFNYCTFMPANYTAPYSCKSKTFADHCAADDSTEMGLDIANVTNHSKNVDIDPVTYENLSDSTTGVYAGTYAWPAVVVAAAAGAGTRAAPTEGIISRDEPVAANTTELYIHPTSKEGRDLNLCFERADVGDILDLSNNNNLGIESYVIEALPVYSSFWTVPVRHKRTVGATLMTGDEVTFSFSIGLNLAYGLDSSSKGSALAASTGALIEAKLPTPTRNNLFFKSDTGNNKTTALPAAEHSDATDYFINEVVIYGGHLYTCLTDHTAKPFDYADWKTTTQPIGFGIQMTYEWDDAISGDPGVGRFGIDVNNIDPSLATAFRVSKVTALGNTVDFVWGASAVGDIIGFEENAGDTESIYAIVSGSPIDNGTYFDIPIDPPTVSGSPENNRLGIGSYTADPMNKMPPGGTTEQRLVKTSDANYDTQWINSDRMRWKGLWVDSAYKMHDVVRDGEWTMVAIADTEERAGPQPIGDPFHGYNGTMTNGSVTAKQLLFGNRFEFDENGYLLNYRIYTYAGQAYDIYSVTDPEGLTIVDHHVQFTAMETGWLDVSVATMAVGVGTVIDLMALVIAPAETPMEWTGNWNYKTPNNATIPGSGVANQANKVLDVLNINYIDNDGGDRTTELQSLTVGDVISADGVSWIIQSVSFSGSNYVAFGISPSIQVSDGVLEFTFETVAATPIQYAYDTDYWLTQQYIIEGMYGADTEYGDIIPDNTAYGTDLVVQRALISQDWNMIAFAGIGAVTGGEGGGTVAIVDDLVTQDANKALSANQGYVLDQKKEQVLTAGDGLAIDRSDPAAPVVSSTVVSASPKHVGTTPPENPGNGDEWFNSANGQDYTYIGGGTSASYDSAVLALAPLSYYKMDEVQGSTVCLDYSGNGYDANFSSSPDLEQASIIPSDVDGTSMRGNASKGRLSGIGTSELNLNSNETFSLVIPFKVFGATDHFQQILLGKADAGEPLNIFMNQSYPGYEVGVIIGSQNTWGQHDFPLPENYRRGPDPCHMIITYDGAGTFRAYIQGEEQTVLASDPLGPVANPPNSAIPNHVSSSNYDAFVNYGFQGIAQFDYELDTAQALTLAQAYESGGSSSGQWVQNGSKQDISAIPSTILWPSTPAAGATFTDDEGTKWACLSAAPDPTIWGRVPVTKIISPVPPLTHDNGGEWYNSANGQDYTWIEVSAGGASFDDTVLALGPVAYYKMDQADGSTVATDSSVSGLDGSYENTPVLGEPSLIASDPSSTAMRADADWGRFAGISTADIDFNIDEPFSIVFPFKVNNTVDHFQQLAIFKSTNNTPFSIWICQQYAGYVPGLLIGSHTTDWGQTELALDTKYLDGTDPCVAIITYDGAGGFNIYIEGIAGAVAAGPPLSNIANPTNSLIPNHLTAANIDAFTDYTFQKVAIFDYELSAGSALDIYTASLAPIDVVTTGIWVQNGDKQTLNTSPSVISWPSDPLLNDTFTDGEGTVWQCLKADPVVWGRGAKDTGVFVNKTGDDMSGRLKTASHLRAEGLDLDALDAYSGVGIEIFVSGVQGGIHSFDRTATDWTELLVQGKPVNIRHDNASKLNTKATGIDVSGQLDVTNSIRATAQIASTDYDLAHTNAGPSAEMYFFNGEAIFIGYDRTETEYYPARLDGEPAILAHKGTQTLETTDEGITVTGDITAGAIYLGNGLGKGVFWEDGKHTINNNDGGGNFNIRVGNNFTDGCTEAGYVFNTNYAQSSGVLEFDVSNASLNVGDTPAFVSPLTIYPTEVRVGQSGSDISLALYKVDNNVSDHVQFFNGTTRVGEIGCEDTTWLRFNQETAKNLYTNRSWYVAGNVIAYYSDERLKDIKYPITGALGILNTWRAVHYNANETAANYGYDVTKNEIGLLTQDIEPFYPEVIEEAPCSVDDDTDYKTLKYERLVPVLVAAIQELTAKVEELEKRLDDTL